MSIWEDNKCEEHIKEILCKVPCDERHHLNRLYRPFLTPYQIAIEFERRFPKEFHKIGLPRGGVGTGVHKSFSQYIARQLSTKISDGSITDIDGAFLSNCDTIEMKFRGAHGDEIVSSMIGQEAISMFRICRP